uniref:Uncharacterized protein n=1 Tax=Arion vulgaris TaxID=1028688 RepID=A0A0B7B365_9EUPU
MDRKENKFVNSLKFKEVGDKEEKMRNMKYFGHIKRLDSLVKLILNVKILNK